MDEKIQKLEKEIATLQERNMRVEADKAWETSNVRIFSLAAITYFVAAVVMYLIGVKNFLSNALVPMAGFFLSVQSLPIIKRWWIKRFLRK